MGYLEMVGNQEWDPQVRLGLGSPGSQAVQSGDSGSGHPDACSPRLLRPGGRGARAGRTLGLPGLGGGAFTPLPGVGRLYLAAAAPTQPRSRELRAGSRLAWGPSGPQSRDPNGEQVPTPTLALHLGCGEAPRGSPPASHQLPFFLSPHSGRVPSSQKEALQQLAPTLREDHASTIRLPPAGPRIF
ncbi:uncharacterized protein [Vicugna pacos]|uniref:Uncharacterized protein n=1 Tax=Vicugna pacos TaxID=30538 RepID=A0ABM5CVI7_VICPA